MAVGENTRAANTGKFLIQCFGRAPCHRPCIVCAGLRVNNVVRIGTLITIVTGPGLLETSHRGKPTSWLTSGSTSVCFTQRYLRRICELYGWYRSARSCSCVAEDHRSSHVTNCGSNDGCHDTNELDATRLISHRLQSALAHNVPAMLPDPLEFCGLSRSCRSGTTRIVAGFIAANVRDRLASKSDSVTIDG